MKTICIHCSKTFQVFEMQGRDSNGAIPRIDSDGFKIVAGRCHQCTLLKQRIKRKELNNAVTQRYEKTFKGFLMRCYRNMRSRVTGVVWKKAHLYKGLPILHKEEFHRWARNSETLKILFSRWEESGWKRNLVPSVDRVDTSKGYTLDNMEWVTFSENCRRSWLTRKDRAVRNASKKKTC